jgi:hypothetical protein
MFNLSEASPILREVILPNIRKYLVSSTVLLKYFQRNTQKNETGEFIIVYHKSRNNNAGSGRAEEATLPSYGKQGYGRSTVGSKYLYTRCKWSGQVIAATKSKEAMVNALVSETKGTTLDTEISLNRQLNSDRRDALGFWVSTGSNTVIVADEWGNVGADHFQSGTTYVDLIDVSNSNAVLGSYYLVKGALTATGRQLSVYSDSSATTPTNISGTAAAGDYFVLNGTLGKQVMGIRGIIDDANPALDTSGLQGVSVATFPEFVASIVGDDGSTAADWEDLKLHNLQRVLTEIDLNSDVGRKAVKFILTSQQGLDTYAKVCRDEKLTVNPVTLDGGFQGVAFNGMPMVADRHFRRGAYAFVAPEHLMLCQLEDISWDEKDGSMFYRQSGGDIDGVAATLFAYIEGATDLRNAFGMLVGQNMIY